MVLVTIANNCPTPVTVVRLTVGRVVGLSDFGTFSLVSSPVDIPQGASRTFQSRAISTITDLSVQTVGSNTVSFSYNFRERVDAVSLTTGVVGGVCQVTGSTITEQSFKEAVADVEEAEADVEEAEDDLESVIGTDEEADARTDLDDAKADLIDAQADLEQLVQDPDGPTLEEIVQEKEDDVVEAQEDLAEALEDLRLAEEKLHKAKDRKKPSRDERKKPCESPQEAWKRKVMALYR